MSHKVPVVTILLFREKIICSSQTYKKKNEEQIVINKLKKNTATPTALSVVLPGVKISRVDTSRHKTARGLAEPRAVYSTFKRVWMVDCQTIQTEMCVGAITRSIDCLDLKASVVVGLQSPENKKRKETTAKKRGLK